MFQAPSQPNASISTMFKDITIVLIGICIFGASLRIGYQAECEAQSSS